MCALASMGPRGDEPLEGAARMSLLWPAHLPPCKGGTVDIPFDISQEELQIFLDEADEQLQTLEEGLVLLEQDKADGALLSAMFRAAHTLKGSSGLIGHRRMADLTHALETLFDGVRKGDVPVSADLVDLCLRAVDGLRLLNGELTGGEPAALDVELLMDCLLAFTKDGKPPREKCRGKRKEVRGRSEDRRGWDHLQVSVEIAAGSAGSAARAYQVLLALRELGEVLRVEPDEEYIERAEPVRRLTAEVRTEADAAGVLERLKTIAELERVVVGDQEWSAGGEVERGRSEAAQPPRLGEYLVSAGYITQAQLKTALKRQAATGEEGELLGRILVEMGTISQEVLDEALAEQSRELRTALQAAQRSLQERQVLRSVDQTVRTSIERLDTLMNLVGELITSRNRLNRLRAQLTGKAQGSGEGAERLLETIGQIGRITDQLQEEVMQIRMQPVARVFQKFPRLVRDLARKSGKLVEFVIEGEDTELDRSVIEKIGDPLIHLLRNAVDHGIEPPEVRRAAGKPEAGRLLLSARHHNGQILLLVEDDGRGIDVQAVRAEAERKGFLSRAEAASLSDAQAIELIFASGLSTAEQVSEVSGRGVGMDIVRRNIEELNGSVSVQTSPGRGTRFEILLPLTLAVVPSLLVRVGRASVAIPLATVVETVRIPRDSIEIIRGRPVLRLRERLLPLVFLWEAMGLGGVTNGDGHVYVVAIQVGTTQAALVVDSFIGEEEIMVKPLSPLMRGTPGISGTTILGDGSVALILDVQGLLKSEARCGRRSHA